MDYPTTLKSLNQLHQFMVKTRSLDELLWGVTNTCTRLLRLEDFVIYIYKKKEELLVQSAAYGEKCIDERLIINPMQIPIGKGIVGISALTKSPQQVNDTRQNIHYLVDDQPRRSELAVPIIWNNKVIGVVDSEHHHQNFFSSTYLDFFCLIANLSAPIMAKLIQKEKKKTRVENKYYQELIRLLEEKKVYRNKSLSLQMIARLLDISSVYLSQIIHQVSDQSFSALVNQYRVREVKLLIKQNKHLHYNILSLAYQAGFNSKSSFNANFKSQTRLTPSQFIKQLE